jgi:hypothetical protein
MYSVTIADGAGLADVVAFVVVVGVFVSALLGFVSAMGAFVVTFFVVAGGLFVMGLVAPGM